MVFNPKDKEHKKQLYKVLRALADLDPTETVETLFDKGVDQPVARGIDYMNNVRKGDFNSTYAALIHSWLCANHFPIAHKFAPKIFPETLEMRWRSILDQRGKACGIRIVRGENELGIVERHRLRKVEDLPTRLSLSEPFFFQLEAPFDGIAVALQGHQGAWYLIPLGPNEELLVKVEKGLNNLPLGDDGNAEPLSENNDTGKHQFAIVTFDGPQIEEIENLSDLVTRVEGADAEVFVAPALVSV